MKVNLLKVILAVILILCLFEWNYGFYQLVRFLGFVGFSILAYQEKEKQNSWFFIWLFSALLINPFLKVSLGKTIWNVIDVIWAVLLAVNVIYPPKENRVKNNLKTTEKENFNFKNAVFKYFFDEDLFTFYDFEKFDMINTKYAYHYLKSVFSKVEVQKGSVTTDFRKMLGVQSVDEKKDRENKNNEQMMKLRKRDWKRKNQRECYRKKRNRNCTEKRK